MSNSDRLTLLRCLCRGVVLAVLGAGLATGCGSNAPSPSESDADVVDAHTSDSTNDTQTDVDEGVACLDTAGCRLEPGLDGTVCVDSLCQPCESDEACVADYGIGATCREGRCDDGCFAGQSGCPCLAGVCDESFCIDDACVDCEAGETGCVCGDGNECETDALCSAEGICDACPAGSLDCLCNPDNTCDAGFRCGEEDLCEICPSGQQGCPCDEDASCGGGLVCMMDLCVEDTCVAGAADCPCTTDGTCGDETLYCADDDLCRVCEANAPGCACDADDVCVTPYVCDPEEASCRDELTCEDDLETLDCAPRQLCDDGDEGEDAICAEDCEPGFEWTGSICEVVITSNCAPDDDDSILPECTARNRACVETPTGASCEECLSGYVDSGSPVCRAVVTCEDYAPSCIELGRECVDDPDADASCGACIEPFTEPDAGEACVLPPDASCEPGAPSSILEFCADQNRRCIEGIDDEAAVCGGCDTGFAEDGDVCCPVSSCVELGCASLGRTCEGSAPFESCGACLDGLSSPDPSDPLSACRESVTCEDLDCAEGEFCVEGDGIDARCSVPSCDEGSAQDPSTGLCTTCDIVAADCDEEGHTGRIWPFTRDGGECLCETEDGYYLDTSSALIPRLCDIDGDGWVVNGARPFVSHLDEAVRANARCDVRTIDRVTLQNDLLQRREILLCADGSVPADEGACVEVSPLDMYEPALLDEDEAIAGAPAFFPVYQNALGEGRTLLAAELNPLTRACVTGGGDFNGNGVPDVQEAHGADTTVLGLELLERTLFEFAYYVELHRGWFEARPGADFDTYVIAERSRCDGSGTTSEVPLTYASDEGSYWRECYRRRDASYDAENPRPTQDFARWTCTETSGPCAEPAPLTTDLPGVGAPIPLHSSCDASHPPADGVWRGMGHHSQFRCVELDDDGGTAGWQLDLDTLRDPEGPATGSFQFNECRATSSTPADESGSPTAPEFTCEPARGVDGEVGFVAVRYRDGRPYELGCVDESEEFPELCPGFVDDPDTTIRDGVDADFGRLVCGCGRNHGGPSCTVGCPDALTSAEYGVRARTGWWVCGTPVQTAMEAGTASDDDPARFTGTYGGNAWGISGRISASPRERTELSGTDGSAREWTLR